MFINAAAWLSIYLLMISKSSGRDKLSHIWIEAWFDSLCRSNRVSFHFWTSFFSLSPCVSFRMIRIVSFFLSLSLSLVRIVDRFPPTCEMASISGFQISSCEEPINSRRDSFWAGRRRQAKRRGCSSSIALPENVNNWFLESWKKGKERKKNIFFGEKLNFLTPLQWHPIALITD